MLVDIIHLIIDIISIPSILIIIPMNIKIKNKKKKK